MVSMYHDLRNKVKLTTASLSRQSGWDSLWPHDYSRQRGCQLAAARGRQTPKTPTDLENLRSLEERFYYVRINQIILPTTVVHTSKRSVINP